MNRVVSALSQSPSPAAGLCRLRVRGLLALAAMVLAGLLAPAPAQGEGSAERAADVADLSPIRSRKEAALKHAVDRNGFTWGSSIYIRIFKKSGELELWMQRGNTFDLFRSYSICKRSGNLGPKQRQGDLQSPEGFYSISPRGFNPYSNYHLALDIGYPNAYDEQHGYTGGMIMIHGDCKSVGCYAMTDGIIEEIYLLAEAAMQGGQYDIPVHIFPFHLTDERLEGHDFSQWFDFWRNLKEGYDLFEKYRVPPTVTVEDGRYEFKVPLKALLHARNKGTASRSDVLTEADKEGVCPMGSSLAGVVQGVEPILEDAAQLSALDEAGRQIRSTTPVTEAQVALQAKKSKEGPLSGLTGKLFD